MKVKHKQGKHTSNLLSVLYSVLKCIRYGLISKRNSEVFEVQLDFPINFYTNSIDPGDWYKVIGYKSGIDTSTNNESIVVYRTKEEDSLEVANYTRRHEKIKTIREETITIDLKTVRYLAVLLTKKYTLRKHDYVYLPVKTKEGIFYLIYDNGKWVIRIYRTVTELHLLPVWPHAGGDKPNLYGNFSYNMKVRKRFVKHNTQSAKTLEEYISKYEKNG